MCSARKGPSSLLPLLGGVGGGGTSCNLQRAAGCRVGRDPEGTVGRGWPGRARRRGEVNYPPRPTPTRTCSDSTSTRLPHCTSRLRLHRAACGCLAALPIYPTPSRPLASFFSSFRRLLLFASAPSSLPYFFFLRRLLSLPAPLYAPLDSPPSQTMLLNFL